jgi:hypothetical protein
MTATQEHTTPWIEQHSLFISGENGYHTYRIPALVTAVDGTLLAFCEGRKGGRGDAGEIDLLLTRSHDQGQSWEAVQVVVSEVGMTCGNPCPVVDGETGVIWLPFCKNLADGDEDLITQGKAPRTVWITSSRDNGQRWPIAQTLYPGPSAYSDLTSLTDGTICCLYERGDKSPYETLTLARFNLAWLQAG